ncbi:MAG: DUF3106 domain-containing protein [Luteimonas sp.]
MRILSASLRSIAIAALLVCGSAVSAPQTQRPPPSTPVSPATALPAWDHLSAEQRALLIAPLRERWNDNPGRRAGLYRHAQRWQTMTPEQRKNARRGKQRWDTMDPAQRAEARVLFDSMRGLSPDQRKALRAQWRAMTPEQRREWVQKHGAATP